MSKSVDPWQEKVLSGIKSGHRIKGKKDKHVSFAGRIIRWLIPGEEMRHKVETFKALHQFLKTVEPGQLNQTNLNAIKKRWNDVKKRMSDLTPKTRGAAHMRQKWGDEWFKLEPKINRDIAKVQKLIPPPEKELKPSPKLSQQEQTSQKVNKVAKEPFLVKELRGRKTAHHIYLKKDGGNTTDQKVTIQLFGQGAYKEVFSFGTKALLLSKDASSLLIEENQKLIEFKDCPDIVDPAKEVIDLGKEGLGLLQTLYSKDNAFSLTKPGSSRDIREVAIGPARGLAYAHKMGWIWRDFKPDNIVLKDGEGVLADAGLAVECEGENLVAKDVFKGTPTYVPPEIAKGKASGELVTYSSASDMWAYGVSLYRLLYKELPPFIPEVKVVGDALQCFAISRLKQRDITFYLSDQYLSQKTPKRELNDQEKKYLEVIRKCLQVDPTKRPAAQQVVDDLEKPV